MGYSELKIQKALFKKFESHKYRFTNVFFFENESDFLSFLPNGYCYEVEVKISRSDFFVDFKKNRHDLRKNLGNEFYIRKGQKEIVTNPSWELTKEYPELVVSEEYRKFHWRHGRTEELAINFHMHISSRIDICKVENKNLPNKFFYAVPKGLIQKHEVPDYAGLLWVNEDLSVDKIKEPNFLHRDVLQPERVFNTVYYSYANNLYKKLNEIKYD